MAVIRRHDLRLPFIHFIVAFAPPNSKRKSSAAVQAERYTIRFYPSTFPSTVKKSRLVTNRLQG
jgi:hypothetical protein